MIGAGEVLTFPAARSDGSDALGRQHATERIMLLMNVVSQIVFSGAELCKAMHSRRDRFGAYPFANGA